MSARFAASALLAALSSPCACGFLLPYSFEVVGWTPGSSWVDDADALVVGVAFSREADRPSAESAFSLSAEGAAVLGSFSWAGAELRFSPYAPLRDDVDYELKVGTGAMDLAGVSLERAFEERFSAKPERGRPRLVSSDPPDGGRMVGGLGALTLVFDEAIDPVDYRSSLSITPRVRGSWRLYDGGSRVEFSPTEPWARSVAYELEVDAGLRDEAGNETGRAVTIRFIAGLDGAAPELASAYAVDDAGAVMAELAADDPLDGEYTVNRGWETRWRLRLEFSEPVAIAGLASAFECESGPDPVIETIGEYAAMVFWRFDDKPDWNDEFSLRLEPGVDDLDGDETESAVVYRVVADGPGSKPPRFVGLRIPLAPGAASAADRELTAFPLDEAFATMAMSGGEGRYPIGVATSVSVELYIELAEGAGVDLMSTMESFSFSATNGSLEFDAERVVAGGFDDAAPHEAWSDLAVVRVDGTMTNRAECGVVTFRLSGGYADSAGNEAPEDQCLSLLK